jgi:hypothetical protein
MSVILLHQYDELIEKSINNVIAHFLVTYVLAHISYCSSHFERQNERGWVFVIHLVYKMLFHGISISQFSLRESLNLTFLFVLYNFIIMKYGAS